MKQFLRSIKSESVTVFRAQSPLLPQLERYLGSLAVRVEWVDEPAALKQADGGVVIVPLGIDTIPQTLAIFDMIEERLLPGVWPVLATDLYLPAPVLDLLKKGGFAGVIDFLSGATFTRFSVVSGAHGVKFHALYRELLLLLDGYMRGNLSPLFRYNAICSAVVSTSPIVLCVTDTSGRILFFNTREENIRRHSVSPDDIYGKNLYDFTSEPEKLQTLFSQASASDETVKGEVIFHFKELSFNFSLSARKLSLYGSDVVLIIGINVTRQRQAEGLLMETEEKYRMLVENSSEGICLTFGSVVVYANPRFYRIFALSERESVSGFTLRELIHPEDYPMVEVIISGTPERKPRTVELRGVRKTGGRIDIELTISSFSLRGEMFTQTIVRDITETKKLWQNIVQYERLSAIGELVSGISHEFNNIITSIRGYIQYSSMAGQDINGMRETLGIIDSLTEHGANIIKKLSMLTRQEIENRELCSLASVVDEQLAIQEKILFNEGITLHRDYRANPLVSVDRALMRQVILNIVVNAIHAIRPKGGGSITVTIDGDERAATLTVRDTGTGIDDSIGGAVFTPFFTTKKSSNDDVLGTGMGLPISRSIVEQHGGAISFRSEPGSWTEFTIELPACPAARPPEESAAGPAALFDPDAAPLRLLVADDNPGVRDLLRTILHTIGVGSVDFAVNGAEAVSMAGEKQYDLIILDVSMPVMTGFEAFRLIRESDPSGKVVFITGHFQENQIRNQVQTEKAFGYITKPFDINEVSKLIKTVALNIQKE